MLFEKLKTYNTPAKLLEKLKEVRQTQLLEVQQKKLALQAKTQHPWTKRKISTQNSQRSTWGTLKTLSTSPQVKSQLDIIKMKMPTQFTKSSNASSLITELPEKKKLLLRTSDAFKTQQHTDPMGPVSLNQSLEEQKLIDELYEHKVETMDELYREDTKEIDKLNEQANVKSQKLPSDHTPAKSPAKRFLHHHHHHHHQGSNSGPHSQKTPIVPDNQELTKKAFNFKIQDSINEERTDREKYIRTHQIGNRSLARIHQKDFRQSLKNFEKLNDYIHFYKQQPNIYMQLHKSSKKQNIFQSGFGLISDTPQIFKANASAQIRTNQRVKVFSEALQAPQCRTLTTLKLSHNALNSSKIQQLVHNFPQYLQELDLMNNGIDSKGCLILAKYIAQSHIKKVNLENNKIGDLGSNHLCLALTDNDYLIYLNLSRNNLTENCSVELGNYLKKTQALYELYLHFNSINSVGAINIWKALYKNSSVKVFDISYNRTASLECAQTMAKVIVKSYPELMHIDVSHNGFDEQQSLEIKKALENNQNIYGFHYEGNCSRFTVDATGHLQDLQVEEEERLKKIQECRKNPMTTLRLLDDDKIPSTPRPKIKQEQIQQVHRFRRIQGLTPIQQNFDKFDNLDSCWICEGWQEIKFTWTPGKSGGMDNDPIFVHLNFEGYKPQLMTKLQGEYYLYRMCPPNSTIHYFFTNPVLGIQTVAKNQLTAQAPSDDPISYESQEFLYNGNVLIDGNKMSFVNEVFTEGRQLVVERYIPKIYSKPREEERIYDLSQFMHKKQHFWSYEISIFKNYQPDNDELIDECFEYDFGTSKINRFVKDVELQEIKEILREYYPFIFTSYKLYVSMLIGASIPCISNNAFVDFLGQTTIIDQKMRASDIDLNFISTSNVKDVTYPNVYEKALVRYQFMEVLVRIALDKYYRTSICKTQKLSLLKLFEEDGLKQRLMEVDRSQDWRDTRYWNEQCDMILKDRLPMLKLLFKYTAKLNPKQKYYKHTWIQFKDFRDLINKCDLYCDTFVERDAYIAFLLAMQTQVDELYQLRHFQMEFYEFLEALSRCAEKLSLIRTTESYTMEERRAEPLHKKLDAFTLFIYLRVGDTIKYTLKEQDDFTEFDKCMIKKQKALKQILEETGDLDEKPYNPSVEESTLTEQLKQVIVFQPTQVNKKGLSFLQVIKQAQQQNKLKNNFNLTNIVSYFKHKEEEAKKVLEEDLKKSVTQLPSV